MRVLIALLLISACAVAAISAGANWDVAPGVTGASNTNGGFFVPGTSGTTDYSHGSARATGNDLSSTAGNANTVAPTVKPTSSFTFNGTDVKNGIYITGGNCTTGWYQITAFNSGSITLDRAVGSGSTVTNCTYAEGGSINDPGIAIGAAVRGNIIHLQAPASGYTVNCATANTVVAGVGCITNITASNLSVIGYKTSHFDYGAQFTINAATGVGATTIFGVSGSTEPYIANITINCNNLSGTYGTQIRQGTFFNIWIKNCPTGQQTVTGSSTSPIMIGNYVTGATTGTAALLVDFLCVACEAINNSVPGIAPSSGPANVTVLPFNISANNTGGTSHGFANLGNYPILLSSVAYGNGGNAVDMIANGSGGSIFSGDIFEGNGGAVFHQINPSQLGFQVFNTSWYGNTGAVGNSCPANVNNTCYFQAPPSQTVSAFVSGSTGNFALNLTPGGGLLMRGTAYPNQFKDGINKTYLDLGAVQYQPEVGYMAKGSNGYSPGLFGVLALIIGFVGTRRLR